MALDIDTVKTIALLARLKVAEDQLPGLARELSGILGWVEQLAEVDTEGVAPMTSVAHLVLPERADEISDGGYRARLLANAPAPLDDYFSVPKVVE